MPNTVDRSFVERIASGDEHALLLDVRNPDEVLQGSIPTSKNIPLPDLQDALALDSQSFEDAWGFEKPSTSSYIVVYCRSGRRAATAADAMVLYGYTNVDVYPGSWLDWSSETQTE